MDDPGVDVAPGNTRMIPPSRGRARGGLQCVLGNTTSTEWCWILPTLLPDTLRPLATVAFNYRWSWTPGGPELFASIDAERWRRCRANPVRLLRETSRDRFMELASDPGFMSRLAALPARMAAGQSAVGRKVDGLRADAEHPIAFMCSEFAVHSSLPVYSGGLGVLAGDILKEASDQACPSWVSG